MHLSRVNDACSEGQTLAEKTQLLSESTLSSEHARFSLVDAEMGSNVFKPVDG